MKYLAHNGVDHGSTAEAVVHSSTDIILKVALVTAAVLIFTAAALWAVKNLAKEPAAAKKDKK